MFKKIAGVNVNNGLTVVLGYDIPAVITPETNLTISTKIVAEKEEELDVNSESYKQAQSVAEVLRVGFDIGCAYTNQLLAQHIASLEQQSSNEVACDAEPAIDTKQQELILE